MFAIPGSGMCERTSMLDVPCGTLGASGGTPGSRPPCCAGDPSARGGGPWRWAQVGACADAVYATALIITIAVVASRCAFIEPPKEKGRRLEDIEVFP